MDAGNDYFRKSRYEQNEDRAKTYSQETYTQGYWPKINIFLLCILILYPKQQKPMKINTHFNIRNTLDINI